jgi:hypothetical protein
MKAAATMRHRRLAAPAFGFFLALVAGGAQAADPAATPTPSVPAPPSASQPTAAAPMPPESRIAAAMAMLDATNAMSNVTQLIDSMLSAEANEIKRRFPATDETKFTAVEKLMHDAFVSRQDEYKRLVAIGYAQHFSEEELRALTAFYRGPVGKHYIETMPALIKDMTPVGMVWAQSVMADIRQKIIDTMHEPAKGDHT